MSDPVVAAPAAPASNNTPVADPAALNPANAANQPNPAGNRNADGTFKADPAKSAAPKADEKKPEPPRRHKLKVDGREEELEEAEVLKWAQMGRAAQKRFQEAAEQRKQAEDFIRMLKEDPESVLTNPAIGVDLRAFAEKYLSKQLQKETLTPEQKRIQELEEKLKAQEERDKKVEESKKQEEMQRLKQHFAQDFDKKISEALASSGLPKSPKTVKRVVDMMVMAMEQKIQLTPQEVIPLVRRELVSEISSIFDQTDGDGLLQLLGDGIANKIRKADLARLRAPVSPAPAPAPKPVVEEPEQKIKQPKNLYEWREEIERRVKGN